jgi:regulator of protease activity HflC (stomatin/prohibitin superfamily)
MTALLILLLLAAVAALFVAGNAFKIIGQAEVMVIERLGRFHRVARSGFNLLIPFVERPRAIDLRYLEADPTGAQRMIARTTTRIDLREQVLNFPSQPVITKDNVTIDIDAVLYYRIADPQKATYAVQNLPYALETLTRTTLRNIVGEMELDATLASRDQINGRMREVIEEAAISWGVDVTRVELQSIEPPRDIQQAMELQMRAERERRAAVTNAEASKRAAVLEAEGARESQVRRAEGEKEAAILRAQGWPRRASPWRRPRRRPSSASPPRSRRATRRCTCSASSTSRRCRAWPRGAGRRSSSPPRRAGCSGRWARCGRCSAPPAARRAPRRPAATGGRPARARSGLPPRLAPPAPDPDAPMRSLIDAMGATPRAPGGDPVPR